MLYHETVTFQTWVELGHVTQSYYIMPTFKNVTRNLTQSLQLIKTIKLDVPNCLTVKVVKGDIALYWWSYMKCDFSNHNELPSGYCKYTLMLFYQHSNYPSLTNIF